MNEKREFPSDFLWGTATSAHQVEGGNRNDWTEWEKASAKFKVQNAKLRKFPDYILQSYPNPLQEENYISGKACDHYNRYGEDFDSAKQLGHNAHRFSLEWSRIEPAEGKFNEKEIEHYQYVIRALRERGMEPFVTLWHFTLPLWLRDTGGVCAKDFSFFFERYASRVADALPDVRYWTTFNEPEVYALNGYYRGIWPPHHRSVQRVFRVMRAFQRAHQHAYHTLKKDPKREVGVVVNQPFFESAGGLLNNMLTKAADWLWNGWFLRKVRNEMDFIGCNYYFHNRVCYGFNKNENKKISDMGWEVYPEGIYYVLMSLKKYCKPIYITENGVADAKDALRAEFIQEHVRHIQCAHAKGADVRGYFYWSLLDNFEWDKGFWPRFGLVEVDYKTMERKIRKSARISHKIQCFLTPCYHNTPNVPRAGGFKRSRGIV